MTSVKYLYFDYFSDAQVIEINQKANNLHVRNLTKDELNQMIDYANSDAANEEALKAIKGVFAVNNYTFNEELFNKWMYAAYKAFNKYIKDNNLDEAAAFANMLEFQGIKIDDITAEKLEAFNKAYLQFQDKAKTDNFSFSLIFIESIFEAITAARKNFFTVYFYKIIYNLTLCQAIEFTQTGVGIFFDYTESTDAIEAITLVRLGTKVDVTQIRLANSYVRAFKQRQVFLKKLDIITSLEEISSVYLLFKFSNNIALSNATMLKK